MVHFNFPSKVDQNQLFGPKSIIVDQQQFLTRDHNVTCMIYLYLIFFIPDSTDDAMQVIFTDFKRINETHFWSESSQEWLHQMADNDFDNLGPLYWLRAPYKGPGMCYTVYNLYCITYTNLENANGSFVLQTVVDQLGNFYFRILIL